MLRGKVSRGRRGEAGFSPRGHYILGGVGGGGAAPGSLPEGPSPGPSASLGSKAASLPWPCSLKTLRPPSSCDSCPSPPLGPRAPALESPKDEHWEAMAELFDRDPGPCSQPHLPVHPSQRPLGISDLAGEGGPRGRDLKKQKQVESGGQGRLPRLPPSARRLMLGVRRHLLSRKREARQINTDGGRDADALFMGDRPSPASESLIYQAEETSHPLATVFPPSCDWGPARLGAPPASRAQALWCQRR